MTPRSHRPIPALLPPANCFTVLVIDDMPQNRLLLHKFLKASGYAVHEAADGVEALDLLSSQSILPDLIITDIEMPTMDGIALVEQIRILNLSTAEVPIIAASGNANDTMRREAIRAGSDRFLTKPFDLKALQKEIAALLKKGRKASSGRTVSPLEEDSRSSNRFERGVELLKNS